MADNAKDPRDMTQAVPEYACGCGQWTGERCEWEGPLNEMVVVEYMPVYLRSSHTAAGGSGTYPYDGSVRVAVCNECADLVMDFTDADGEDNGDKGWVTVLPNLDPAKYAVPAISQHSTEMATLLAEASVQLPAQKFYEPPAPANDSDRGDDR